MIQNARTAHRPRLGHRRRGISLVEVIVSIVIMGTMIVTSLNLVGAARVSDLDAERLAKAERLAEPLMAEILAKPYQDPDGAPGFGVEADDGAGIDIVIGGETVTTGRERFDDVDDYHGYDDDKPSLPNGSKVRGYDSWSRHVTVRWVDPDALQSVSNAETGTKRVRVRVRLNGSLVATLTGYRTLAWDGAAGSDSVSINTPPVAVIGVDTNHGENPLAVDFDAGLSFDLNGDTLSYDWDFGDGATATGETTSHTFGLGVHTVTLTVTDGQGGKDRDTVAIYVRKAP